MGKTTIFGHRGVPRKYIENSIDGFEYIAQKGEAVEFDVHLTKDFQPIVMHDEKLIVQQMDTDTLEIILWQS